MLRVEFERLLQILRPESVMDKEDLQKMKDKVFGPQTFFVTETRLTDDFAVDAGWLVRSEHCFPCTHHHVAPSCSSSVMQPAPWQYYYMDKFGSG